MTVAPPPPTAGVPITALFAVGEDGLSPAAPLATTSS
jgi:hypothetical protein